MGEEIQLNLQDKLKESKPIVPKASGETDGSLRPNQSLSEAHDKDTIGEIRNALKGIVGREVPPLSPEQKILETIDRYLKEGTDFGIAADFDENIAVLAGKIGHEMGLGFADSVIYATAWIYGATLWTQDEDFKNIASCCYERSV